MSDDKFPQWFGSSGIRGNLKDIGPEFCFELGKAVALTLNSRNPVYLASDIRSTSGVLKTAFMSGYSSYSGVIIDIGLMTTPVLSYVSGNNKTLGVMVTASHNPPSDNGFKFFFDGRECVEDFERRVEKNLHLRFEKKTSPRPAVPWHKVGTVSFQSNVRYIEEYLNLLSKKVEMANTEYRIILDCANNVPSLVSPFLLQKLGFGDVMTINEEFDPLFTSRPSEPSPENLRLLIETVKEENADIGIAHDGDGDRFAIIDEKGSFLSSTSLICFFLDNLRAIGSDRKKVVLTSDCTKQAFEIAKKKGAEIVTSQIGKLRIYANDQEAYFLAEPYKLIFPEIGNWIDGIFPVLKLLEMLKMKTISEQIRPYDKRKILRKAFKLPSKDRLRIKSLLNELPYLWSRRIKEISTQDGIKIFFKDDSNLLIRFSGTELKIKFYIESSLDSRNQKILKEIISVFGFPPPSFDC
ncbi:MAG: hypothetical protein ACFFE8_14500 [Candidatus Heimdallarchaeota archaeon]